jgi:hypothetical protein
MSDNFIQINSDWGKIGNIYWVNSNTMPHALLFYHQFGYYWGAFTLQLAPDKDPVLRCKTYLFPFH